MKRVARILAAVIVGALASVGGIVSEAAADVGPVKRVSCPSVAQVNALHTSTGESRTLVSLTAGPSTCDYSGTGGGSMSFRFYPDASTLQQVQDKERAKYPPEFQYLFRPQPIPALGSGAFYFADTGPTDAYWLLSPGAVADMTVSLSWQETEIVAVARLFRPTLEVYTIPGERTVNGRQWRTSCENYSRTARCRTEIYATVIKKTPTGYVKVNGWAFNSLTYRWSDRALWKTNPLGHSGSWTSAEGRKWRTDCDSLATGRGACRSYLLTTVIDVENGRFVSCNKWVFNNQVLFS